jgi:dipeptidase D
MEFMEKMRSLEPVVLWKYFEEICRIPRPSRNEEKIRLYLVEFAKKHQLDYLEDKAGNLLIKKPATKGMGKRRTVVLQSHMDMVGEKNSDSLHDFKKDPIQPFITGEWVKAKGTTLGADDGIGIAAQLSVLAAKDISHGPIECLFTFDEETGLTGAFALKKDFFEGDILLNLDSEDEGEIFIGCAGGNDTTAIFKYNSKTLPDKNLAFEISVKGLTGGHSGDDIHKGRGNSNKIINRFLWNITRDFGARLAHFDGGNLRNAIAREAKAIFSIAPEHYEACKTYFDEFSSSVSEELKITEPGLILSLIQSDLPEYVINKKTQARLLGCLYACPHGVIEWSREMPGLVETSTNLASVKFINENEIQVTTSQRSSVDSARKDISDQVQSVFEMGKAKVSRTTGYPGWKPNSESEILSITRDCYIDLFGNKPIVRVIHAGLECGLFLEKYPELDMVSFGPTIKGAHSPDERLNIESTVKFWKLLLAVLEKIPNKK